MSTDQSQQRSQQQIEARRTPDGGDSSQSQSQSSQDSPSHSDSPKKFTRKGSDVEKSVFRGIRHRSKADSELVGEREGGEKKGETKKPEMLIAKPVSTVTVVQRRSPSLTIRSVPKSSQQHGERNMVTPLGRGIEIYFLTLAHYYWLSIFKRLVNILNI